MSIEIRKAERRKAKLRLGLAGPSGSGKTMSALKIAKGLGGSVCLIDTERGSGDLYANLYDYSVISLEPPFKPAVLVEAIASAEKAGFDTIIIDSLSHFWSDEGGILDQADKLQNSSKNRFTVWADLTPQHRQLVNALLNSPKHIIGTMRSKQEYALETDDKGKTSVKKLGLAPVQRDGMEYEFTLFFDITQDHYAKTSKDRTNMFKDEVLLLDETVGERLLGWLNDGKEDKSSLKKQIMSEFERLGIPVPLIKEDRIPFLQEKLIRLTGLELNDDNLQPIVDKLKSLTDRREAYKIAFEMPQNAPQTPVAPANGETLRSNTETAADKGSAPVNG